MPVARLLAAARAIPTPPGLPEPGTVWLQTTIDGWVIPEPPMTILKRGGGQRVPMLIGSNAREIPFYANAAEGRAAMRAAYGPKPPLAAYGLEADDRPASAETLLAVATDLVFTCPAALVAKARVNSGVPVWRYILAYTPKAGPPVTHSSDLRYIFGAAGEGDIPADAPPLQAYWVRFAYRGDPNGEGLPAWPRTDHTARYLDIGSQSMTVRTPQSDICRDSRFP